jgi:colicin import membrane protein
MSIAERYLPHWISMRAIYLIAAYAVSTWAYGQNDLKNAVSEPAQSIATQQAQPEAAERARIAAVRKQASTEHQTALAQCYQRFAVTGCILDAKKSFNSLMADLRRQEIALNDLDRKRRGAEQLQRIEDKRSADKQLELSERRGRAMQAEEERQKRAATKRPAASDAGGVTEDAQLAQARAQALPAARGGATFKGEGAKPVGAAKTQAKSAASAASAASASTQNSAESSRQAQRDARRAKMQARLKERGKTAPSLPEPKH